MKMKNKDIVEVGKKLDILDTYCKELNKSNISAAKEIVEFIEKYELIQPYNEYFKLYKEEVESYDSLVLEKDRIAGYVYVMKSHQYSNCYKIGKTIYDPDIRARQLSKGTGVLVDLDYIVIYSKYVPNCSVAEKMLHAYLDRYRIRSDREFFEVDIEVIIEAFDCLCEV